MSHFLKTAAEIVGGIALVATGVGAAAGAGWFGLTASVETAAGFGTFGALATVSEFAGLGALALGIGAQLTAKKPKAVDNPMAWQSDPQAGIPIIVGERMYSGGKIIYRDTWGGSSLPNETLITVYSVGPTAGFQGYYVDGVLTSISGDTANIPDYGFMHVSSQVGAQPEAAQLGALGPPNWTTSSKLSGLTASSITLIYDTKGSATMTTEPQCGFVLGGVRVYDPRKDDTYPGGSGPQRWNDETTWSLTGQGNPYLVALAWLIGWHQNGKLVAGVGVPISAVLVDQFVEGANVSDANGWKCAGILDTTDDKWSRLKDILQAGGGEPIRLGAQIGCLVNTPRVSLATITVNDVVGDASVQATQAMRDRVNAIVPRYMAEQSLTTANPDSSLRTAVTWGMAAAGAIIVDDYVTFDGKQRQKQVDYPLVTGATNSDNTAPNQVAQLARYDIENSREFGPITLPLKLRWMGYKPGDVVTANLPELGLVGQDILLLNRALSPQAGTVTMTARSETAAKHPFALGQTTIAPPTPSVTGPALVPTPGPAAWSLTGGVITADNGTTQPVLELTGSADSAVVDTIVCEYRLDDGTQDADANWKAYATAPPSWSGTLDITGLQDGASYDVAVSYRRGSATGARLILGPAVCGQTAVPYQSGVIGPKPPTDADNTDAAWQAATGGETIQQTRVTIDSLTASVTDLTAMYGDTASAAASATAAQAAQTAAEDAETNAATAASQAQAAYTAADQARQLAANAAGAASSSADGAAGSASDAAISASAAHQSEVSASTSAAALFPSTLTAPALFTPVSDAALTAPPFAVGDPSFSAGVHTVTAYQSFGTIAYFAPVSGRTYRVTTTLQVTADQTSGITYNPWWGFCTFDAAGAAIAYVGTSADALTVAGGKQTYSATFTGAQLLASGGAFARPVTILDWHDGNADGSGVGGTNATVACSLLLFEDITESTDASDSASAAASSASSAAASQTGAGNSASAAAQSATNAATSAGQASTFAGNASTSASQASTSASDAAGSANTASSYATQAANSASSAGGSASAAATQASNAASSATAAGNSATSASTSANSASSNAGSASTSASSASSSAAAASSSASAAQQSATLAANIGPGDLDANPRFTLYASTAHVAAPDGWAIWNTLEGCFRAAGKISPWCVTLNTANNPDGSAQNGGISQYAAPGLQGAAPGWYVLALDFQFVAGALNGMGLYVYGTDDQGASGGANGSNATLRCEVDPDIQGIVRGAGTPGASYSFRKLVYLADTRKSLVFHYMHAWDGFGVTPAAKIINLYYAGIRPATDGEIAGKQALSDAATALAQISANQSAQASVNSAQALTNTSLQTQISQNTADITTNATAISNVSASATQQLTMLQSYVSAGTNLCPDVSSWQVFGGPSYATGGWGPAIVGTQSQDNAFVFAASPQISVYGGRPLTLSVDLVLFADDGRCSAYADMAGYDASGAPVWDSDNTALAVPNSDFSNTRPRTTYSVTDTPPENVTSIIVRGVGFRPDGATISALGLRRPKVEQGSSVTAYTTEGQTASLSASVQTLSATTTDLGNRINTAVFQVSVQAGGSRGLLEISADGFGASAIDLVAGSLHIWSQDGANAILAMSTDATGKVTIPNLAAQQIVAAHFVTDQGVDLAAIVPGQFDYKVATAENFHSALSGGQNTGVRAIGGTVFFGQHEYTITVSFAATSAGTAGDGNTFNGEVHLMANSGSGWNSVALLGAYSKTPGQGSSSGVSYDGVPSMANGSYQLGYMIDCSAGGDPGTIDNISTSLKSAWYK